MRLSKLLAAAALSVAPTALAQPRDATARVERLADGVYAILHDDATDEWPHGNTGVIVTDEGVVAIDSCYLPSRAKADIALIRQITDKPVRYLLNTHWHFDHNNGAVAYRDAFPGLAYVAERESAGWIELNQVYWSRMTTAPDSAKRQGLAALEKEIATGTLADGKRLPAGDRERKEAYAEARRGELRELETLTVVKPTLTFEGELTLVVGGRRLELRDVGRANSPHDVTVYLPAEKVLFTGDILVQSPLPFTGASWPVQWVSVLKSLEAIPIAAMVPGHGPVMRDHTYTRDVRALMEAVTTRVEALARAGKTLDQVQAAIDLEDIRQGVPAWSPADQMEDWKQILTVLVERAWRGVRGQG